MQLIQDHLHHWDESLPQIAVCVDRLTLAKRRWRGVAEDETEFGFDLEHQLQNGDVFYQSATGFYRISQTPEPVLAVSLEIDSAAAARLGWIIGNLHFQLGLNVGRVVVPDDSALRQLFEREHISFVESVEIFQPLSGGHHH